MNSAVFYDASTSRIIRVGEPVPDDQVDRNLPGTGESKAVDDYAEGRDWSQYMADADGVYHKIRVSTDKATITADGSDSATVTAQVDDTTFTGDVTFDVGGSTYTVAASGGVATFSVSSTSTGDIAVTAAANPSTGRKWGSGNVTIIAA